MIEKYKKLDSFYSKQKKGIKSSIGSSCDFSILKKEDKLRAESRALLEANRL